MASTKYQSQLTSEQRYQIYATRIYDAKNKAASAAVSMAGEKNQSIRKQSLNAWQLSRNAHAEISQHGFKKILNNMARCPAWHSITLQGGLFHVRHGIPYACSCGMKQCQITILSSANWEILAPTIEKNINYLTGIDTRFNIPAFGQYPILIQDSHSSLYETPQDYWVVAERLEDFLPTLAFSITDETALWSRFEEYLSLLRLARSKLAGHIIIHAIDHTRSIQSAATQWEVQATSTAKLLSRMNDALHQLCNLMEDTSYLPLNRVLDSIGRQSADPGKYYLLGRSPYSQMIAKPYSALLAGHFKSLTGRTVRALVLDLDNTLWGGIIGDDGMAGIDLGPDYPGNQFVAFQQFIKTQMERGVVLTLCSKNDESVAFSAVSQHPAMILKDEDFVDRRINWAPKSKNIRELSTALRLGLGSMMVLDDNPVERHEIRTNCPGIHVPELPHDVSEWPEFLARLPGLYHDDDALVDTEKTDKYKLISKLDALEQEAPSREAFLKGLRMSLKIEPLCESTRKRTLQLLEKTSQFNTTTRRYSEVDVRTMIEKGAQFLTVCLKDKYGTDEIIAVAVTEEKTSTTLTVTSFVMSCRVMGRDVESGILAYLSEQAVASGYTSLDGEIIHSERNSPCHRLYENHGFIRTDDTNFRLSLIDARIRRPTWFQYETGEPCRHAV